MKWNCNTCGARVKGDVCPGCGAIMPDPATTPATDRMRRAIRSLPFVLGVVFFTLALLLSLTLGILQYRVLMPASVHQAITSIESETGLTIPDTVHSAIDKAMEATLPDVSDIVSGHLLGAIACLGLWLLMGTGSRAGRIGRSGAVLLKVITIFELVCVCLGIGAVIGAAVLLVAGREWLLSLFVNPGQWEGVLESIRAFSATPAYAVAVWVTAGVLLAALLLALFFLIGAIRTENEVIRVSKIGQGRKVSVFLCVMMFIGAASEIGGGLGTLLTLNWHGAVALMEGLALLLFGITILRYRHWSREVLWSDVHPEAMDKAIAAIPTDLNTADLLGEEPPAEPAGPEVEPQTPEEPEEPEVPETPEAPEASPAEPEEPGTAVDQFMASIRSSASAADDKPAAETKPAAPSTTVCPHCGAVMEGKAFFCEQCGQLL